MRTQKRYNKCPKCLMSFIGPVIPKNERKYFGKAKVFRKEIAIFNLLLDRTVAYKCPYCKFTWERV